MASAKIIRAIRRLLEGIRFVLKATNNPFIMFELPFL